MQTSMANCENKFTILQKSAAYNLIVQYFDLCLNENRSTRKINLKSRDERGITQRSFLVSLNTVTSLYVLFVNVLQTSIPATSRTDFSDTRMTNECFIKVLKSSSRSNHALQDNEETYILTWVLI